MTHIHPIHDPRSMRSCASRIPETISMEYSCISLAVYGGAQGYTTVRIHATVSIESARCLQMPQHHQTPDPRSIDVGEYLPT